MKAVLVTGSNGLAGSESVRFFCELGYTVIGVDNDMRQVFFGAEASTQWRRDQLIEAYGARYIHYSIDIRDQKAVAEVFQTYGGDIELVIHAAAQPSHDWAAREPFTDFTVNANGTLILLENTRQYCPTAVFIYCSTNKVYGDNPNRLPLVEAETRWEIEAGHPFYLGIDESMSIDHCKHSLFGASKTAADLLVQEYGRYFDMKTAVFRCGCITGPSHSGAELHGFLSYIMKCTMTGAPYQVFGYKGKQVRDNIHSHDLANAFYHFYRAPRAGEVYNMGGGRFSNCSLLEAIQLCEAIAGRRLNWRYLETNRSGDHIWWISSNQKFKDHFPAWDLAYTVEDILGEIFEQNKARWTRQEPVLSLIG
jgi:CDP-paratose 2-epimerase